MVRALRPIRRGLLGLAAVAVVAVEVVADLHHLHDLPLLHLGQQRLDLRPRDRRPLQFHVPYHLCLEEEKVEEVVMMEEAWLVVAHIRLGLHHHHLYLHLLLLHRDLLTIHALGLQDQQFHRSARRSPGSRTASRRTLSGIGCLTLPPTWLMVSSDDYLNI